MFEVIEKSANRLDIVLDGQIDADQMKASLDVLIEKSKEMENAAMLYTITNFALPTLGAFGVEMKQLPKLFGLVGVFRKCAVVTDTGWIGKAAEVEGVLIPGLEIKSFDIGQEAAAEAWLASAD